MTFLNFFALTLLSALEAVKALPVSDALPARSVRPRQLGQVITSCTVPNTAALTFDDGPYIYIYVRHYRLDCVIRSVCHVQTGYCQHAQ